MPIYLHTGNRAPVPGTLEDLSEGGMRVRLDSALTLPGAVTLQFDVRSGVRCTAEGKVVRIGADAIGVQFSGINDDMRQFVRDLVSLRSELRSAFLTGVIDPRIHLD